MALPQTEEMTFTGWTLTNHFTLEEMFARQAKSATIWPNGVFATLPDASANALYPIGGRVSRSPATSKVVSQTDVAPVGSTCCGHCESQPLSKGH